MGKGCIHGFMDVDVAMRKAGVQSGTTAVLALLNPDEIVVANCGDSRSVLRYALKYSSTVVQYAQTEGEREEKRREGKRRDGKGRERMLDYNIDISNTSTNAISCLV